MGCHRLSLPGEKQSCLALHGAWSQSKLVCLWIKTSLGRLEPPTHVFHWGEGLHFFISIARKMALIYVQKGSLEVHHALCLEYAWDHQVEDCIWKVN